MEIKTAGVMGLGALGVPYADLLTKTLGKENVFILADEERTARYKTDGVYLNDVRCDFGYTDTADPAAKPLDFLLFAVKFGGLEQAIEQARPWVGTNTILVSVLNGIVSEQMLGDAFGAEKVVWCTAQRMSALKEGNRATCPDTGELALGVPDGLGQSRLNTLTAFLQSIPYPYQLPADIRTHMWGKLLCNVGCNQVIMTREGNYSIIQHPGEARDEMIVAMREVVAVANAQGIPLSEEDITHWCVVLDSLHPESEPSMRQDGKAHRKSEVELFAGTIRRLGRQFDVPTPVNDELYQKIKEIERTY